MLIHAITIVVAALVVMMVVLSVAAFMIMRGSTQESRLLAKRVGRLPWRRKLWLARRLLRDPTIPLWVRAIPFALLVYLAMPLDIIPDFIPVLGQLDDLLVLIVGGGMLMRLVPRATLLAAVDAAESGPTVELDGSV